MSRLAVSLAAALLLPLLWLGTPDLLPWRPFYYLWDFGHVVLSAALAWCWFAWRPASRVREIPLLVMVFCVVLLLGALVEALQHILGREASLADLARNLVGAFFGFAFRLGGNLPRSRRVKLVTRVLASILVAISLAPLLVNSVDFLVARSRFPVLSNLESLFELSRWEGESLRVVRFGSQGNRVLRADFSPGEFSSAKLSLDSPDWRGYRELALMIFSDSSQGSELHLRINDSHHALASQDYDDRYNRVLQLETGWNRILIKLEDIRSQPKRRAMDLSSMDNLALFTYRESSSRTFYIDNVELRP